ncbi:MAG TPA: hypothetical protein VMX33_08045 [bacterium]|nr:hypothetical protein [bacterium]
MKECWKLYRWKTFMWVVHDGKRGHGDLMLRAPWMPSFYPLLDSTAPKGTTVEVTFSDTDFEGWALCLTKTRDVKETIVEYHDQDGNVPWIQAKELLEYLGEAPAPIYVRIRRWIAGRP